MYFFIHCQSHTASLSKNQIDMSMDKIDLEKILHALNTFPKAFFVWGILEQRLQRPAEMEEKLREEFPYLCNYTFLNRKNFNQYCHRSLKEIVIKDYRPWKHNLFQKEAPAWGLIDDSIQPIAGFMLTKCVENGVNCESFLASGKNSSSLSNVLNIRIFEGLYRKESSSIYDLAYALDLNPTSVDRHLLKMASNNFAVYATPSSKRIVRKRMVKGAVAEISQKGKGIFENILMPIASIMNDKKYNDRLFRKTVPTDVDLIKAMEVYAKGLKLNPTI